MKTEEPDGEDLDRDGLPPYLRETRLRPTRREGRGKRVLLLRREQQSSAYKEKNPAIFSVKRCLANLKEQDILHDHSGGRRYRGASHQ